jgi:hypothetical protein
MRAMCIKEKKIQLEWQFTHQNGIYMFPYLHINLPHIPTQWHKIYQTKNIWFEKAKNWLPELEDSRRWKRAGTGRLPVGGWVWVVGDGAWQYLVAGDGDGSRQWSTVLIKRWGTSSAVALSEMENDGGGLVRKWSPEPEERRSSEEK